MMRTVISGLASLAFAYLPSYAQAAKQCDFGENIRMETYHSTTYDLQCYFTLDGKLAGIGFPRGGSNPSCHKDWRKNGIVSSFIVRDSCDEVRPRARTADGGSMPPARPY